MNLDMYFYAGKTNQIPTMAQTFGYEHDTAALDGGFVDARIKDGSVLLFHQLHDEVGLHHLIKNDYRISGGQDREFIEVYYEITHLIPQIEQRIHQQHLDLNSDDDNIRTFVQQAKQLINDGYQIIYILRH